MIHTVGPVWYGGSQNEKELIASCYRNCLKLASENNLKTIAFPSISTGTYRFPLEIAAKIAMNETLEFLRNNNSIEIVILVCFVEEAYKKITISLRKYPKKSDKAC